MFIEGRFHLSSFGESCLDKIFLVARTEETNAELCRQQISVEVEHRRKQLKNCYAPPLGGLQSASVTFAAVDILLSITTFLGNSLILVALNKESSLHPPSKLFYRCLATTDLLVGLVAQPLRVTYWMSVVHEQYYVEFLC